MLSSSHQFDTDITKLTEIHPMDLSPELNFGSVLAASSTYIIVGTNNQGFYVYSKLKFPYQYLFKVTNEDINIKEFCTKIELFYDTFVTVNKDTENQTVIKVYKIYASEVKLIADYAALFSMGYDSSLGEVLLINQNYVITSDKKKVYLYVVSSNTLHLRNVLEPIDTDVKEFGKLCSLKDNKLIVHCELINGAKRTYVYDSFNLVYIIDHTKNDKVYSCQYLGLNDDLIYSFFKPTNEDYNQHSIVEVYLKSNSLYFNGKNASIAFDKEVSLNGDFTTEAWIKLDDYTNKTCILGYRKDSGENYFVIGVADNKLYFESKDIRGLTGSSKLEKFKWYHVAVTRKNKLVSLFVNGVLENQSESMYRNPVKIKYVGSASKNVYLLKGYVSNLRVLDGTSLYNENFSLPKYPLRKIDNTLLLLGNTRYISDENSSVIIVNYENVVISDLPINNQIWVNCQNINLDNSTSYSIASMSNMFLVVNPYSDYNGKESGSFAVYDNIDQEIYEQNKLMYISPEYSHGGMVCKTYEDLIFFSAVDENINGINKVGKIYVFKVNR